VQDDLMKVTGLDDRSPEAPIDSLKKFSDRLAAAIEDVNRLLDKRLAQRDARR
jgi:hypothetical protein